MKLVPAVLATGAGTAAQALGLALAADSDPSWPTVVVLLLAGIVVAGFPLLRASAPGHRAAPSLFNLRAKLGFSVADASVVLAFGIFLPALGLLGLGLAMIMRSRSGPRRKRVGITETEPPRLSGSPLQTDQAGRFGPGSLEGILRHSPNPELRLRVVLACRQLPGRLAVPLLRLALRDRVDDVRLLAYAVLDGRERQLQTEITSTLQRAGIKDPLAENTPVGVRSKLAELYFEMVYQGLVEGELLSHSLEQVLTHALAVLKAHPSQPRMALLAGRALIVRRKFEQARSMLEEALRRGLSIEVVGPYLAEVEYELRQPDNVRRAVAEFTASARLRPVLAQIVERWS
jgi:polysaccharide biosynthesis protein PelE